MSDGSWHQPTWLVRRLGTDLAHIMVGYPNLLCEQNDRMQSLTPIDWVASFGTLKNPAEQWIKNNPGKLCQECYVQYVARILRGEES